MRNVIATLAAATFVIGCTEDAGEKETGTVIDSAGIAVVTNAPRGTWTDATRPEIVEDLRIGVASGDPNQQFGLVVDVSVGADGSIWVLDAQAGTIRVFTSDGRFNRAIGRAGAGPGELSPGVTDVLLLPGDTALVPDFLQQRVQRFAPDGRPAGEFPLSFETGYPVRWDVMPGGAIIQHSRPVPFGAQPATERPDSIDRLLVRASDGTITDTLLSFASPSATHLAGTTPQVRLFVPEPVWAIGSDGTLFFARNSELRVEMRDRNANVRRITSLPVAHRSLTQGDQQEFRQLIRDTYAAQMESAGITGPGVDATLDELMEVIQFADAYPAFNDLMAGPSNTLWTRRVLSADELRATGEPFNPRTVAMIYAGGYVPEGNAGSTVWDVFDADGVYLGPLELPARFTPLHVHDHHIYGVARDSLDVQYVVRLAVEPPPVTGERLRTSRRMRRSSPPSSPLHPSSPPTAR